MSKETTSVWKCDGPGCTVKVDKEPSLWYVLNRVGIPFWNEVHFHSSACVVNYLGDELEEPEDD